MADENMTQDTNVQQDKKMTVKLKPLALEKATGEQAPAKLNIPVAPAGATASGTVKFNPKAVAASEPGMPTAQDLAKQTIKLAPPPRTGLPKPPPATAAAPSPRATQVVKEAAPAPAAPNMKKATQIVKAASAPAPAAPNMKKATQIVKPGLIVPKPVAQATATQTVKPAVAPASAPAVQATATQTVKPVAAPTPAAAPDATQKVKKPGLAIPKPAPAAPAAPAPAPTPAAAPEAAQTVKKPGLAIPKPAPAAPAAPAPVVEPAPAAPAASDADAKKVQEEGLKPREGGGSGLGMKKVEQVAEEDLPDALKPAGSYAEHKKAQAEKIMLKGPADEPGGFFTAVVILAFIFLLIGVYVQFFGYSKWMPEMDAHADKLPAPPTGVFSK